MRPVKFLATAAVLGFVGLAMAGTPAQAGPIRDAIKGMVSERRAVVSTRGMEQVQISVAGQARSFLIHTPPGFNPAKSYGAVMIFHGGQGDGSQMEGTSRMSAYADSNNFIAVYPNAGERQWNDGRLTTRSSTDDVAFVRAIINVLASDYGVDRRRVFAGGISNGGMMVQKLACEATGDFSGFAVIAANMPVAQQRKCRPSGRVNMVMFHGTADPLMPYAGGKIKKGRKGAGGKVESVDETVQFWSSRSGCGSTRRDQMPDSRNDGTTVSRATYQGCSSGSVIAYRIEGGGHTWPGSGRSSRVTGKASQDIDASAVMLDFFRSNGL